jgi:TPR repeat protein
MRAFAKKLVVTEAYEDAIATYITIAEQTPGDPRSHYDVAGIMVFLRMYNEAIPRVNRAISLDPDNALYHELAALSYMQMERFDEAFEATRKGAQLGDIKAMYTLSGMYEHGRGTTASPARALHWLEQAASSGHMGAMDAMARVYRNGLYGVDPDPARQQEWEKTLERALAQ